MLLSRPRKKTKVVKKEAKAEETEAAESADSGDDFIKVLEQIMEDHVSVHRDFINDVKKGC